MSQSREKRLDPVTFEILHHKLWQITNEMSITLSRVAESTLFMAPLSSVLSRKLVA